MPFDSSWAEVVPPPPAQEGLIHEDRNAGPIYQQALAELEQVGDPDDIRASLSWIFRLALEDEFISDILRTAPSLDRLAVGFIDPEIDPIGPAFGFVAYSRSLREQSDEPEHVSIRNAVAELSREVDGVFIPVSLHPGERNQEVRVTSPSSAFATTWAKNAQGSEGWLVPRHAVDVNSSVDFSDGSRGGVSLDWDLCIDTALVGSIPRPPGLHKENCLRAIAPKMQVEVTDQHGTQHNAVVVDVDFNLAVVRHKLFPIRFSYDWPSSKRGDSGALVLANPCGEIVGMHQGSITVQGSAGSAAKRAYALCLYQLEDHGGLEMYR